ncbi:hypothetical protein [Robertkochia sediminum]|uniref:hypothetical protein n=1 Tax=Robertkochia sediminum TaxID=2785326 RepID=UPI001932C0D2|nr:hypothetical protein [Robertkochia sediminum]MBL7471286.1 hypothetical protein [Robertkochia sediminum]
MKKVILGATALLMTFALSAQEKQQNDARRVPYPGEGEVGVQPYVKGTTATNGTNEVFINQDAYKADDRRDNVNVEDGNDATVNQDGTGNFTSVYQGGVRNNVDVTQGNTAVQSTGSVALIEVVGKPATFHAEGAHPASDNTVEITQYDNPDSNEGGNVITVDLSGRDHNVDVRQKGAGNNTYESKLKDGSVNIEDDESAWIPESGEDADIDGAFFRDNNDPQSDGFRNTLGFSDHVDISGSENDAFLTQEGDNNQANVKIGGDYSSSTILQGGDSNTAWSYQAGQETSQGDATKLYRGANNNSTIQQGAEFSPDGLSYDNNVYLGPEAAEGNYAGAIQYGDDNTSNILQLDFDNAAVVKQVGEYNMSDIEQKGSADDMGNDAYVEQTGSNNWADADQMGNDNTVNIYQDYTLAVDQDPALLTDSSGDNEFSNESTTTQTGTSNFIEVRQNFDDTSVITQNGQQNSATVEQTGTNINTIDQIEGALGNSAEVTQSGSNTSTITQKDGSLDEDENQVLKGNKADVNQVGSNTSTVTQTGGYGNYAYVEQSGSNTSTINQIDGDNNSAWVYQEDSGNTSTINQGTQGYSNTAWVSQKGMEQTSTIYQYMGENNFAEVEQLDTVYDGEGRNVNTMTQEEGNANNAFLIQNGASNTNTLYQTGNHNIFNAQQYGKGNTINVTQSGQATYPEN